MSHPNSHDHLPTSRKQRAFFEEYWERHAPTCDRAQDHVRKADSLSKSRLHDHDPGAHDDNVTAACRAWPQIMLQVRGPATTSYATLLQL